MISHIFPKASNTSETSQELNKFRAKEQVTAVKNDLEQIHNGEIQKKIQTSHSDANDPSANPCPVSHWSHWKDGCPEAKLKEQNHQKRLKPARLHKNWT